jgi:hypothetical protein
MSCLRYAFSSLAPLLIFILHATLFFERINTLLVINADLICVAVDACFENAKIVTIDEVRLKSMLADFFSF